MRINPTARAYTAAVLGALSVWWAAPLVKLARVDPLTAAWWRFVIGALVVAPLARGKPSTAPVAAGVALYVHMILWFDSLRRANILASTALVVTYPVFISAWEALRREIPAWRVLLVAVPLAAAVIYTHTGIEPIAAVEALASSLAVTLYFVILRESRLAGIDAYTLAFSAYSSAAITATVILTVLAVNPLAVPPAALPFLTALGVLPMGVGHTLLNYALAYLPASIVSSLVLSEPFGAALIARLVLGEEPPPEHWILAGLLLLVSLSALYSPRTSKTHQPRGHAQRNR